MALVQTFDIEGMVVGFLADASRSSLEFPHMTTAQRKRVKNVAESHLELECVSYGMGNERKLHIFKKAPPQSKSQKMAGRKAANMNNIASVKNSLIDDIASVKNLLIDDWVVTEEEDHPPMVEPGLVRSMPAQLCKSVMPFNCLSYGPPSNVKSNMCADQTDLALRPPSISTCSTVASSASSAVDSPRSDCPEPQLRPPNFFRPPPGLEVPNTFVHVKDTKIYEHIVQCMPQNMFRQSLLGSEVIIQGLLKLPAFNGLSGKVDSLDDETGRYTILLTEAVGQHTVVKVKFENLRWVSPRRAPALQYERSPERNLTLSALL